MSRNYRAQPVSEPILARLTAVWDVLRLSIPAKYLYRHQRNRLPQRRRVDSEATGCASGRNAETSFASRGGISEKPERFYRVADFWLKLWHRSLGSPGSPVASWRSDPEPAP